MTAVEISPSTTVLPNGQAAVRLRRTATMLTLACFDRVGALLLLLLLSPLLLLAAAALWLTSPGPVLFRQPRVGRDGRSFRLLKFRTMVTGAEALLPQLQELNVLRDGPLFKLPNDPRVTPIGRHLRRWSLDEMPQLLNVLAGSMSLVGPRPALEHEAARYTVEERRRLVVKPGLTGLWQINGRCELTWADGVGLDLEYVETQSLRLNLRVLAGTPRAVLRRRGAW